MISRAPPDLVERIDAALPQTQCTRCGFPDCARYAQAIAEGQAAINQCPPGGQEGVERLARITGAPPLLLDPANGIEGPRRVARIVEARCIGCTLCIAACPVDCIVGVPKAMHGVIEPLCTGCDLCLPACPVDCITMVAVSGERTGWRAWSLEQAEQARRRYAAHRLRKEADEHAARRAQPESETKRRAIDAAIARARAQRLLS